LVQNLGMQVIAIDDLQSLDQAVMVAKRHPIDFKKVKSWSTKEKQQKKYQDFLERLQD
jgi:hypothetical protein